MTRQDLAAAMRRVMPNTDITDGNYPVEAIIFNFEPKVTYGLRLYITMEEVGGCEGEEAVAFVYDRVCQWADKVSKKEGKLREMVHFPDMPPIVRERALALLASDREHVARLSAVLARTQALADALAAAIGETKP